MAASDAPRHATHFCVMDFEATCESDEIGIARVREGTFVETKTSHRLRTGDQVRYAKESRNCYGGSSLRSDGEVVADDTAFFVKVVDRSTLQLFRQQEQAVSGQGPVQFDDSTGEGTVLRDAALTRRVEGVDGSFHLQCPQHRLCTGNAAKYRCGSRVALREAGKEVKDGTDFWVKATSSDTLLLFRSKKDAEQCKNVVHVEAGSGAGIELQVKPGVHWVPEIIEFPAVLVEAITMKVVAEFREIVRPTETLQLTDFNTQLTSIAQAQVDQAAMLADVLPRFGAWLAEQGAEAALPVTCGDWDLGTMLTQESKRKGLEHLVPASLRWWCNIKMPYAATMGLDRGPGMERMLSGLKLELVGHHHLGIDDCRNIAVILQELKRRGATVEATTVKAAKPAKGQAQEAKQEKQSKQGKKAAPQAKGASEPAVGAHQGASAGVASDWASERHPGYEYLLSIGMPVLDGR